ncbi:aminoglycoside N(3)-acetyltransferase [Kosmotoga pacifica]|uniref:Aminoglycoside N(3)-acetyltransferase n=1 Tax=Kosmotoga pacifica TaxID=1330330 RepID=A0A0G2ZG37_9BACT|nr:AAC(3) family N-acetyltransferase [Kosmotoga pacifica]AKI97778.1 aminoglycoside 3-N-acetyltransferase [Kosmotoga pacifica]
MSENDAIQKSSDGPVTIESLKGDLQKLGLKAGMTVVVHSSLSSLGWVCGGSVAVIKALEEVLTEEGTLVMPTHSGDYSLPELWQHPPVPKEWCATIKKSMPAFNPELTPTRSMGRIPETFRKQPGVLRSYHTQVSFAAWGKHSELITKDHNLEFSLGEGSPLARIYELHGYALLLGVGYDRNTSIHLAEYRANYPSKKITNSGGPVIEGGRRVWKEFPDINTDSDDFIEIGKAFEGEFSGLVRIGKVGYSTSRLMPQRELVDFAVEWMEVNRL